uniref:Uncharacterized protein n=1 Tax=Sphaerodactylus townsendi TaxID=933632 RepID=A0ACB8ET49_9SAUR
MAAAGGGGAGTPKALPSSGPKSLREMPHPLAASSSDEAGADLTPSPDLQLPRSIADKDYTQLRMAVFVWFSLPNCSFQLPMSHFLDMGQKLISLVGLAGTMSCSEHHLSCPKTMMKVIIHIWKYK